MKTSIRLTACVTVFLCSLTGMAQQIEPSQGESVVIVGTGMASRMTKFGHFETEMYLSFPGKDLKIRNMADEGNTPGFRPHPGRHYEFHFAFPGAKELVKEEFQIDTKSEGHFESPDQWLTRLRADTIIAFFGYNSSFDGEYGLERYKTEFEGFVKHTLTQRYNGYGPPKLVVVSPTAFEEKPRDFDGPDGESINRNLELYSNAMAKIASNHGVLFVDAFNASKQWYNGSDVLTNDGVLLNDAGYRKLARFLSESIFGSRSIREGIRDTVNEVVNEKNWAWLNNFKIPNGVHVYGQRYAPFGPQNYPDELRKTEEMTDVRERAIWAALNGQPFDIGAEDAKTHPLPEVPTNYTVSAKNGTIDYLPGRESESKIETAEGYRMELFASEKEFPELANPSQIAFDNQGRLWVATMPSYPHYQIGDPKPADKLLIFEDADGDGKADRLRVFADDLHIPIGFEIAPEGVYVSQSDSLVLLKDIDGDDKYDEREYIVSGFDDHDTHHAISAFCVDPSGAIIMGEGYFLHSNIETIYGPERGSWGGYFRYDPSRRKLTRIAQLNMPNPWGVAFDDYGQGFFLHTSNPTVSWLTPASVKPIYGYNMLAPQILADSFVRPTSGLEIVSSSHFPEDVQGDLLFNNTIGFLGAKQHQLVEEGSAFTAKWRQDLFSSDDLNFRPVDLEFAPDGSLYVADWHNA
ncbi:MAG TPA: dehydrogenase, partial [Opitutae bacterium]|nr:dehydrogenase [Opitutae bacterium]